MRRSEAQELGLRTYRSGRTCKNGHIDPERWTSNATCTECMTNANKFHYHKNRIDRIRQTKEWAVANRDRIREQQRVTGYHKRKYQQRRDYYIIKAIQRNKRIARNTPSWLTEEQRREIAEFYKNRPEGHHVDHIVPLNGGNVSGLHVPWNLQYLKSAENLSKGNKFPL